MNVATYLVRRRLRRRARSTVGLVLLVALAAGATMGLVAGARRTSSVFPQFVRSSDPDADVTVFAQLDDSISFQADEQIELKRLLDDVPQVRRSARATFLIMQGVDRSGGAQRLLAAMPIDAPRTLSFGRPAVVEGTWPADHDPDAIAIDEELAARAELDVGDRYRVAPYTLDQFGPAGEGAEIDPAGPARNLRVDAIYRYPVDLAPTTLDQGGIYVDHSGLHLTPAYWQRNGTDLARYGIGAQVELAEGATAADLEAALQERIPDRFMLEFDSILGPSDGLSGIERAIDLQAAGMLAVGAMTGISGAALVLLLLGRRAADERARDDVLSALGLGVRARTRVAAVEGAAIGAAGAVLAVGGATLASHWLPFGHARRADLDPGIEVDLPVLLAGAGLTCALVVVGAVLSGRRRIRAGARDSRLASTVAGSGLPPSLTVGVRFALQPVAGGPGLPLRTAMAGVVAATAVAVAALVLVASFDLVGDEPERRGSYGDAVVGNLASPEAAEAAAERLTENADVAAFTGETVNEVTFGDRRASVSAYFPGTGDLRPLVIDGRVPVGDDEVALGRQVMERLDVSIGDTVEASFNGEPRTLHVVGQSLVEDVNGANGGPGRLGLMSDAALRSIDPSGGDTSSPTWFVVAFRDGVDRARALERLESEFPNALVTPRMPNDLVNIERLGGLLFLLTMLVSVLGAAAAALAMLGAVARRQRDLAVLRTFGFVRRQAAATIAWQATTYAVVGLLVGVPMGVAAGSWGWTAVAHGVGIRPDTVVPAVGALVVIAAVITVLNAVAAVPAWLARRLRPADVLRTE